MKKFLACIILATGFFLITCGDKKSEKKVIKQEVSFTKEGTLSVFKKDSLIASFDIEIADNEYETQTGLMYRKSMQDDRGMLFIFPDSQQRYFYMKNTEFSIDIIYISEDNEVVSIQKNAEPFNEASLPSEGPAKYVFEINAGLSDKLGLTKGDRIVFSKI
ncbi:DUF192 domain-containing protein [Spongiivirga sp. MCCC 1A20706]|uniref:DUF192 domain-containing protein n=1 Tax=Spongiivirga sp. MCCC 1A20706 TaxID=3160963 RepID=UPI0039779F95